MSWNHRVAKEVFVRKDYTEEHYTIREVYYHHEPPLYTDAIVPSGDSLEDLEWALEKMLEAVRKCKKDKSQIMDFSLTDGGKHGRK